MRSALVSMLVLAGCGGSLHAVRPLGDICGGLGPISDDVARIDRSPPLIAARILDTLGAEIARRGEYAGACAEHLADTLADRTFGDDEVVASRMLVARIRAVGELPDYIGVMERKSKFLLGVATLDDAHLTAYQPLPGEASGGPSRAWIRGLAVRYLARSNLYLNDKAARAFLRDRWITSHDDAERVELEQPLVWLYDDRDPLFATIVRSYVADVRRRLAGPADERSLEIALFELRMLGGYGPRARVDGIAAVLDPVISAAGVAPIVRGIEHGDDDLLITAVGARVQLASGGVASGYQLGDPPPALRTVPDDWLAASRGEPAGGAVSDADAMARVRELDAKIQPGVHSAPCRPIAERARALPAAEAWRRFGAFAAELFPDGKLWVSDLSECRLIAALAMNQVESVARRALIRRVLAAKSSAYTVSGGDYGNSDVQFVTLVADIGDAIAAHPAWTDDDPELRAWVLGDTGQGLLATTGNSHWVVDLENSERLARGLRTAVLHAAIHDADTTRATLAGWITELHAASVRNAWFAERLMLIALLAPRVGLADEAAALIHDVGESGISTLTAAVLDSARRR